MLRVHGQFAQSGFGQHIGKCISPLEIGKAPRAADEIRKG